MTLPRYPRYKDSGVEWLGEVPGHWEVKTLKRLAKLTTGMTPPTDDAENYADDEQLQWIRPDDLDETGAPTTATKFLSEKGWAQARQIKAGATLICCIGTIGKLGFIAEDASTNQQLTAAEFERSNRYFFFAMCAGRTPFEVASTGNVLRILNTERLGNIPFPCPSEVEATQIASFLDRETAKIDALVAEQRRLMALLKEKRQAVISHAVTRGVNPDAPLKPSGIEWLGDVPAHWEVIALKRIADVQTGVAKGKDHGTRETITVPYLRVANVQDGYLDLETVATMEIPACDLVRYTLKHGDVLMNEGGDFDKLGRGCIWESQIDPCITQNHVFAVRPKLVSSAWLNVITSSDFAQFYFMTRSKQSTNLASISSTNLMELPVVLPPAKEQQAILAFVTSQTESFDTLTTEAQHAIDLLQERRTALISAAVTGKIDVRNAVASD